jgi:hypothetical protein
MVFQDFPQHPAGILFPVGVASLNRFLKDLSPLWEADPAPFFEEPVPTLILKLCQDLVYRITNQDGSGYSRMV